MTRIILNKDDFYTLVNWWVVTKEQYHNLIKIGDDEIILKDIWWEEMMNCIDHAMQNNK